MPDIQRFFFTEEDTIIWQPGAFKDGTIGLYTVDHRKQQRKYTIAVIHAPDGKGNRLQYKIYYCAPEEWEVCKERMEKGAIDYVTEKRREFLERENK